MAERTSDSLTMDMHELDKLAEFNAQGSYQQYSSPQYGSPAPAMSPYSYPDPAQMVSPKGSPSIKHEVEEISIKFYLDDDGNCVVLDPSQNCIEPLVTNKTTYQPSVYTSTPNTTPSSPHPSLASRTTRSGRRIDSDPLGPQSTGVQKSTAPKTKPRPRPKPKKKKKRDERTAPPTVLEPLTVLLAHLDPKKDADIEAYVNRSIETRLREVGDARGGKGNKIKRPMNAFMLYRKGWQNRIKEMQSNENHQGVSKVAGDGWALEPDEVRNQFNTWSEIERDMHAQAFPDYKFQPKKTDKPENKPSIASDGEDTDLEDNWSGIPTPGKRVYLNSEDPDADYLPPGRVPSRAYGYQQQIPPSRAMSQSPYSQSPYQHHSPPPGVPNMSHYQYSNPHKALPNGYPGTGSGHYHAQRIDVQQHQMSQTHPGYSISPQPYQTENVYYHRTEAPSQHHFMAHSPPQHQHLGPPGSSYQHRAAFPGADLYDFQPQLSRSRHPTPAPGHRQPAYAMPFDGIADYGVPIPSPTPPTMAGSDGPNNFNAALGEMGEIGELGDFGDHFQIPPSEDSAYELNFPLADGLDALDPQLLEGGAWTAESLPMGALDRPDDFLDPEVQKKTTPVSGHVLPPLPTPLTPTPDSARISTPVSLTATHDAPTATSAQPKSKL
ncbi:hypothetical protein LQW54_001565 [Pestalotiopsis sp. IQ-011]